MTDQLSLTLAALADPTRRAILARLAEGEATVNELAEPFEMSLPAVSKHLKVLERAGLISRGRKAQWRPCRLQGAPLKDVSEWVERYRQHWEERFEQLDDYLVVLQEQERDDDAELSGDRQGDADPAGGQRDRDHA
jgi:DNA-binding transcriptional ArsR family regulator